MGYWMGVTLGRLGALIVGLAAGVERDPSGRYAMAVIAALTLVAGMGVLWENGPAGEPRHVRVLRGDALAAADFPVPAVPCHRVDCSIGSGGKIVLPCDPDGSPSFSF